MHYLKTLAAAFTGVLFLLTLGCPALTHSDEHEEGTNPPSDQNYFDFADHGGGNHGDDDDIPGDDDDVMGDDDDVMGDDDDMGGMSEEDFMGLASPLMCALMFECEDMETLGMLGWETIEDCIADSSTMLDWLLGCPTGYVYYSSYAGACLTALEGANCASMETGEGMEPCNEVMACDEVEPS